MNNIHAVKDTTPTVEKKPLALVYLSLISLQTRTKLKKSLENIFNCCKWQILLLVLFRNLSVDSAMSPTMVNVLDT